MVPLLLYCSGAGVYGSDEIEHRSESDETIRVLRGGKVLESARIRHFRRSHRELIQPGLRDLIRQARGLLSQQPQGLAGAGSSLPSDGSGPWTCEQEAERRIGLAVHSDSMDLDAQARLRVSR